MLLIALSLIVLPWRDGTDTASVRQECLTGVLRSQITSVKRFSIRRNWRMPVISSRATIGRGNYIYCCAKASS